VVWESGSRYADGWKVATLLKKSSWLGKEVESIEGLKSMLIKLSQARYLPFSCLRRLTYSRAVWWLAYLALLEVFVNSLSVVEVAVRRSLCQWRLLPVIGKQTLKKSEWDRNFFLFSELGAKEAIPAGLDWPFASILSFVMNRSLLFSWSVRLVRGILFSWRKNCNKAKAYLFSSLIRNSYQFKQESPLC